MRKLIAAMCAASVVLIPACGRGEPNSLFDAAGYHVRGDTVYYLRAFPGAADEMQGVDVNSFEVLDRTYAKDAAQVYLDGRPLADADPATFVLLDRPNHAKDARYVYARDRVVSDDPEHYELLDANLSKDSAHVYWSDGSVLSDDPANFEIVSNRDYYTYTRDGTTVHVNGTPITAADPATFRVLAGGYSRDDAGAFYFTDAMPDANAAELEVLEGAYARDRAHAYWMGAVIPGADAASFVVLNGDFECTADATRAYYRDTVIADADPAAFPKDKAVTGCSETGITFRE
ncbi:DKNYY domain-containing protein [Mycolicibacterium arenosum]|uniref:DKNYY domain-containing protein n=1 Tax=Mycolicibacterium arenosum TaxID=2952157 RepID=A0ABT1LYG3_9MYCO|nr:DKNYY domain-containing protein [Mycolicibacterium sp. CAU 1645]MCP9271380.1 DKNYY domain-containing protein [Mycolicibacterium sp. CAU 1645]